MHNSIALEFKWKNKVKKGRVTLKETCPEILAEVEASAEDIERAIEDEISEILGCTSHSWVANLPPGVGR